MRTNRFSPPLGLALVRWARLTCILALTVCVVLEGARATPPPEDEPEHGDPKGAIVAQVDTYWANLAEYERPCEPLELRFAAEIAAGLFEKDAKAFQKIAKSGGLHEAKRKEVEAQRKKTVRARREYIVRTLAIWRIHDSPNVLAGINLSERVEEAMREQAIERERFLGEIQALVLGEEEVRKAAQSYYKDFAQGVNALTLEQQRQLYTYFEKRLQILREHRIKTYQRLFTDRIESERGFEIYIAAKERSPDSPGPSPAAPETNAILDQEALRLHYEWLVSEFALQVHVYKSLLALHEDKIGKQRLLPLLKKAQRDDVFARAGHPLPGTDQSRRVRTEIARVRAKKAWLTSLEEEAKLEVLCVPLPRYDDRLAAVWKATKGAAGDFWKLGHADPQMIGTVDARAVSLAGVGYRLAGDSFGLLVTQPVKDELLTAIRQNTDYDFTSWKTTAEAGLQRYKGLANKHSVRVEYLERLATGLTWPEGMGIVEVVLGTQPAVGTAVPGEGIVRELLEDHDFVTGSNGGLAHVVEALCENQGAKNAVLLHGARHALTGGVRAGLARVAAARGAETTTQHRQVEAIDLELTPIEMWSDVIFEIPTLLKNFMGQGFGVDPDQDKYLQTLVQMQKDFDGVLEALRAPDVAYSFEALERRNPNAYHAHFALLSHCPEYALAYYEIRSAWWKRVELYNAVFHREIGEGKIRGEGVAIVSSARIAQDRELTHLASHAGHLRLIYHALTVNYKAAAVQAKTLEKLENTRLNTWGISARADYSHMIEELEAHAIYNSVFVIYQQLLNKAMLDTLVSVASTHLTKRTLTRINDTWLRRFVANQSTDVGQQLMTTFFPWAQLYGVSGMWTVVRGQMMDLVKTAVSEKIANEYNRWAGARSVATEDVQGAVNVAWDVFGGVLENVADQAEAHMVERSVAWYADKKQYDRLVDEAREARKALDEEYDKSSKRIVEDLEALDWMAMTPEERRGLYDRLERDVRRDLSNRDVIRQQARYRVAVAELESAHQRRTQMETELRSYLTLLPMSESVKAAAIDGVRSQKYEAAKQAGTFRSASQLLASAEMRTRLAVGAHSLDDLQALIALPTNERAGYRGQVLQPHLSIDVLRKALRTSLRDAEAANDTGAELRVRAVAEGLDAIRLSNIGGLVDSFVATSRFRHEIEMIVQSGAAHGNPEYQGIFGDFDFTVLVKDGSTVRHDAIRAALIDHFAQHGHPLAASARDPSSMDSEAMVQFHRRLDPSRTSRPDIIADIQEKSSNPTRFYTEGGTDWFINNAAFNGTVMWSRSGNRNLPSVRSGRERGHGVTVAMSRYLGFLCDPKYSSANLRSMPRAERRQALGEVLDKTKSYLRLVDACLMAHPTGNGLYNTRKDRKEEGNRNESYHQHIYNEALRIVTGQDPADPRAIFNAEDLVMIRRMADMKLRAYDDSPWQVLAREVEGGDDAQLAAAEQMLDWMQRKAPELIAYTADTWHQRGEEVARSGTDGEMNDFFASSHRMISTGRQILELDGEACLPLLVSKGRRDESGAMQTLSRQDHAARIRRSMEDALGAREHGGTRLARVAESQPATDFDGAATRQRVDAELNLQDAQSQTSRAGPEGSAAQRFLEWFQYKTTMAGLVAERQEP